MKNITRFVIASLIQILVFASCDNILDQQAVDSFNEESVFSDLNLVEAYLGNCYEMMDGSSGTGTTAPALSLNKDLLSSATDEMLNLHRPNRSEEHTSELQSLMRISYAVFCLKKKKTTTKHN